jgi:hypothetical protein
LNKFIAILDSGSEINLLSERVYNQLIKTRAEVISCEELAESTNVTTEVAGGKELRLNKVEGRLTPQAQEIKSQPDSHSPEDLQKTELHKVVQQICNINEEGKSRLHRKQTTNNKLHGLSPQANCIDRATAACRRSDCQLLRIKSATLSA